MSYNQKPPGSGGSGMGGGGAGGGGPPNGPNNMPQVPKTFAGIQQQMQNLVHGQNPLPQSSQADLNAFLQQQRIQTMLKQQQQFLQFQQQMQQHQQQQHQQQQQQQQHHNMSGGSAGAGVPVGGAPGGGGGGPNAGGGGSGEPLALTRTPGATELLNKTYQQQANGNPAANPTFNQLQQTLQALPTNFVQQLQAFQYQMQAKQMHQQQHAPGTPQGGGHMGQQQGVPQGVPPPPTTTSMSHQHQQQQQQKHHQQQQQNAAALTTAAAVQQFQQRYLSAAAQAAVVSGNKLSSGAPPPPPPLTNQMKAPNLPPNTQITPVSGANIGSSLIPPSGSSSHQKGPANTSASGLNKHQNPQPPPSISLTPTTKPPTSAPSAAHQQNKFTPPTTNAGNKNTNASSAGHTQNLQKPPFAGGNAFNNATSPAKGGGGSNVDAATGAALKSPQSTPVQLTKQMPTAATTATIGNKMNIATPITTGATTMAPPQKPSTQTPPTATNTTTTTAPPPQQSIPPTSALKTPPPIAVAAALTPSPSEVAPTKSTVSEKESAKLPTAAVVDINKNTTETNVVAAAAAAVAAAVAATVVDVVHETQKKDADKQTTDKKIETTAANKPTPVEAANEVKSTNITTKTESKMPVENKPETETKLAKTESPPVEVTKDNNLKIATAITADPKKEDNSTKSEDTSAAAKVTAHTAPVPETALKSESGLEVKKPEIQSKVSSDDNKGIDTKAGERKDQINSAKSENILAASHEDKQVVDQEKTSTETAVPIATVAKPTEKIGDPTGKSNPIQEQKIKSPQKTLTEGSEKHVEQKTTLSSFSTEVVEVLAKDIPKEKEEQTKPPTKSTGKAEHASSAKINTAPIPNSSEAADETDDNHTALETAAPTAAPTPSPAKKQARTTTKIAKAKTTTPIDNKTAEKSDEKSTPAAVRTKRKSKVESHISDSAPSTPKDDDLDRKSKRHRLKTILYQSPLPELAFITKLSASEASNSPKPMSNEDRLIVFYKNEYMAVRNAEGTFYLCQTMQNVYRTSPRISIRWLSEDLKDSNVYIPDFYDHTDIECVLTTVELKRIDKGHMRLPKTERTRIESILKKAIDVEKGLVPRPELTEENPDGLDISLFKDESQIEKKSLSAADGETGTPSGATAASRKSRRANTTSVAKPAAQTPSTKSAKKRKQSAGSAVAAASSSSSRKSPAKKRKTLIKRKKKKTSDSEDEDEDETSDEYESDAEYKPTQKRTSLGTSTSASKSTPRAQRSPLAKARAASPITPTSSRSRNVPQKQTPTPTPSPSTSKATRGERAAKRKSLTDAGSSEEATPAKRPAITSANNSKTKNKTKTSENVSLDETISVDKSNSDSKASEPTLTTTPNTSKPASNASSSPLYVSNDAVGDGDVGGGAGASASASGGNRPSRCRK